MSKRSKSITLISAAVFISLEIAAFAILYSSSTIQNIWINKASYRVMAALWGGSERVRDFFKLRSLNEELAMENALLQEQIESYKAMEQRMIESGVEAKSQDKSFRYIPASIVKMGRNTARNYIIVNKGSCDGVRPQTGIVTSNGVVGIITAVSEHFAYGLSFTNAHFRVGVKIGPEAVNALLAWDGIHSNAAFALDVPAHKSIAVGDTLWTSGYSSIFPADIPLGVAGSSTLVDGSSWRVEVSLFQDMSSVRYVALTENLKRSEIEALEKEAGDE